MLIGNVFRASIQAIQPNDLLDSQVFAQVILNFRFRQARIPVIACDGGTSRHERSLTIDLNRAAFQHHCAQVYGVDVQNVRDGRGNGIVQGVGSVSPPAIEPPIQNEPFTLIVLHKNGPIVTHPKIIVWADMKVDLFHADIGYLKQIRDVNDLFGIVGHNVYPFSS